MPTNAKLVRKAHTRFIKTPGGKKPIHVKAATKGSIVTNKARQAGRYGVPSGEE